MFVAERNEHGACILMERLNHLKVKSPRNNEAESRFELEVDGQLAMSAYHRRGDRIIFTHTEVPPQLEGKGIGKALATAALDYARSEGLKVVPRCPFIAAFIRRNPEYQDLVDEDM